MGSLITSILIVAGFILALSILAAFLNQKKRKGGPATDDHAAEPVNYKYVRQGRIMSENEAAFFRLLRSTFGESYLVFAQLPLKVVIYPAKGQNHTAAMNKLHQKTIDFALVDPDSMMIKYAIELNDSSHNHEKRQKRDTFVKHALKQAGVEFREIPAAGSYNAASLGPLLTNARA